MGKVFCDTSDTILGLANSALTAYTVRIFANRFFNNLWSLGYFYGYIRVRFAIFKKNGVVFLF